MLGLNGKVFTKDQSVTLNVIFSDPLSKSNVSSGLETNGVRWGLSQIEDCSEQNLFSKSDWINSTKAINITWPTSNPLETFYICLFAKDKANNQSSFLSQPMTSLWTVLVGDNTQGNGGGVTAPNVRFKTLNKLYFDPQNKLQILDSGFSVTRSVDNSTSRIITSAEVKNINYKVYDLAGNTYTLNKGTEGSIADIINSSDITSRLNPGSIAIRNKNGVESILFATSKNNVDVNQPDALAFIFEIPLSTVRSLIAEKKTLSKTEVLNYVIIGNGLVPPTLCPLKDSVSLTPNLSTGALSASDCSAADQSIGRVNSLVTTDSGDLIIATNRDSLGYGSGHFSIRQLHQSASNVWIQEPLFKDWDSLTDAEKQSNPDLQLKWLRQLSYMKQKESFGSEESIELLGYASNTRNGIYDLKKKKILHTFTELNNDLGAGITFQKIPELLDYTVYISAINTSQISRFSSDFKLIETFGRHPWTNRHRFRLQGSFDSIKNKKIVYLDDDYGIHGLDLINGKANTLSLLPKVDSTHQENKKFNWRSSGLLLINDEEENNLLISKIYSNTDKDSEPWHKGFVGFLSILPVTGVSSLEGGTQNQIMGDLMNNDYQSNAELMQNSKVAIEGLQSDPNENSQVKIDSRKNIYYSGKQFKISQGKDAESKIRVLKNTAMESFEIIENALQPDKVTIIYFSNNKPYVLDIDLNHIYETTWTQTSSPKKLLLPGTDISNPSDIIFDKDGNLIVSDAKQGRIIKYFIRDSTGKLTLNYE